MNDGVGSPGTIVDGTESLEPQVGPVPDDVEDGPDDVAWPDSTISGAVPPTIKLESTNNPEQICFLEEGDIELNLFCGEEAGRERTDFVALLVKSPKLKITHTTANKLKHVCTKEVVRLKFKVTLTDGTGTGAKATAISAQTYVIRSPGIITGVTAPGFTTTIFKKVSGKSHTAQLRKMGGNAAASFTITIDVKHNGAGSKKVEVLGTVLPNKGGGVKANASTKLSTIKVTLQLEDNGPKDKNVLIVGDPAAKDKPECDLKIDVTGPPAGTVVDLKLARTGSGDVHFSDTTPKVTVGTTKVVKVYGTKASDDVDKTKIVASRKGKAGDCATLKLTVIEGLKLEFEGNFEDRLALNPDDSYHPKGTALTHDPNKYYPTNFDPVKGKNEVFPEGRSIVLPGEPDFDRVIKFSKPVLSRVACRPFEPVKITKVTVDNPKTAAALFAADSIIGQGVNLGENCWFNEHGATATKEPIDCGGNMQPVGSLDKTKAADRHLVFKIGKDTFDGKTADRYFGGVNLAGGATRYAPIADLRAALSLMAPKTHNDYFNKKNTDLATAFAALPAADKVGRKGKNIQKRLTILKAVYNRNFIRMIAKYPDSRADGVIKKADAIIKPDKSVAMKLLKKARQVRRQNGLLRF